MRRILQKQQQEHQHWYDWSSMSNARSSSLCMKRMIQSKRLLMIISIAFVVFMMMNNSDSYVEHHLIHAFELFLWHRSENHDHNKNHQPNSFKVSPTSMKSNRHSQQQPLHFMNNQNTSNNSNSSRLGFRVVFYSSFVIPILAYLAHFTVVHSQDGCCCYFKMLDVLDRKMNLLLSSRPPPSSSHHEEGMTIQQEGNVESMSSNGGNGERSDETDQKTSPHDEHAAVVYYERKRMSHDDDAVATTHKCLEE